MLVWLAIVLLNERAGLLAAADRFPNPALKWAAYVWLGILMGAMALLVTGSALATYAGSEPLFEPQKTQIRRITPRILAGDARHVVR